MKAIIKKSKIKGNVKIPPSKSYTHRALICAALAEGKSKIISPLISDDTKATINVLRNLGIEIKSNKNSMEVYGGTLKKPKKDLFCGESGTTMRLMTAVCSLVNGKCKLRGGPSLSKRPMKALIDGLKLLGVKCYSNSQYPPVTVNGGLKGGTVEIPGNISSQFISALLIISPLAKKDVKIKLTTRLESKSYVLMTIETQKKFGVDVKYSKDLREFYIKKQNYKPTSFKVEGDWSSSAFLIGAGSLAGEVRVMNLDTNSLQADREIINILRKMNAKIKIENDSIIAKKSQLSGMKFDVSDSPDLFPILCVLSVMAKNKSIITGIKRLRIKESDRIKSMKRGLVDTKVKIKEKEEKIIIYNSKPNGTIIDPQNDHRIAMAFGVLGLIAEGETVIKNADCVSKSFPDYWNALRKINAKVKVVE